MHIAVHSERTSPSMLISKYGDNVPITFRLIVAKRVLAHEDGIEMYVNVRAGFKFGEVVSIRAPQNE